MVDASARELGGNGRHLDQVRAGADEGDDSHGVEGSRRPTGVRCIAVDASIVIVNYQGRGTLGRCLDAVALQRGLQLETIVIDNASPDGSADEAEGRAGVRLVRNAQNVGFGRACNQAAALARGRVLLFLNFDSRPEPDWAAALVACLAAHPEAGAAQGVVLRDPDGDVNTAGNRVHYLGFGWAPQGGAPPPLEAVPYEVFCASGAALAVPRDLFAQVGGFWDELFLYQEDADLSWRIHLAGRRVLCCPAARSHHAYEFSRNAGKYFHLERNRLLMVAANYEAGTLVRLAPALLATEVGMLGVAARGGFLGHMLRGTASALRALPAIRAQRRRVGVVRRLRDREIGPLLETRLGDEFGAGAARASAPILRAYLGLAVPSWRRPSLAGPASGDA